MAERSPKKQRILRSDRADREESVATPFKSYALERSGGPRFQIRHDESTRQIFPMHKHDYFQIIYYLTDAPTLTIGLTSYKPQPGSIYFVAPMVRHQTRFDQSTRYVVIYFDLDFVRPDIARFRPLPELIRVAPELAPFAWQHHMSFNFDRARMDRVERSIASMMSQYKAVQTCSFEIIRAELVLMLGLLCQDHGAEFTSMSARLPTLGRDGVHIRRITDFVCENYTRAPNLSEVARAVRLSRSRLCALIRQYTGSTFSTLIRDLRMDEARERLVLTDETITQIAYTVGYNDEKYFLRAFKKSAGMTPSAYRLQRTRSGAVGKVVVSKPSDPARGESSVDPLPSTEGWRGNVVSENDSRL